MIGDQQAKEKKSPEVCDATEAEKLIIADHKNF